MLPGKSWQILKFKGIPIRINITWIFIFLLVVLALMNSYYPSVFPEQSKYLYLLLGLITAVLFFTSLVLHELSHSLVALKHGIAIRQITLFIFGGVSEMAGEPKDPKTEFKMAIAGPATSFGLSFFFSVLAFFAAEVGLGNFVVAPLRYLSIINGFLAIFNLLPGYPLDGGRVLRAAIWQWTNNIYRATVYAVRGGEFISFSLILFGIFLLFRGLPRDGIWLILIGWFLGQAASASLQQTRISEYLSNVSAKNIMSTDLQTVSIDTSIAELINEFFLKKKIGRFFVKKNGDIAGIVTLHDVNKITPLERLDKTVEDIFEPLEDQAKVQLDTSALYILEHLMKDISHVLVMDNDHLVGIITKNDIVKLLQIKEKLKI